MYLTDQIKIVKLKDQQTAATSDVTSDAIDMLADGGWENVLFLTSVGTAAADNLFHVEQSSDNDADAFADIAGSEVDLAGASDEDQFVEIIAPEERYLRVVAQRGTSSTQGDIWAILWRGRILPFANGLAGTLIGKRLNRPVAGTK